MARLALLIMCGAAAAGPVTSDRMVDVGGSRLHFRVTAGCAPTILLESGGGLDASQWAQLQPLLREATGSAVVSYDRAGFGDSDLPEGALTLEQQVQWLHRGLAQLPVPDRVILVGHSYGAFLTQVFAKRYSRLTDAVVLIDPNTVTFVDSIGGPQNIPISITDDMPPKVKTATERMRDAMQESLTSARNAPFDASLPVTVIAAGKRWLPLDDWNDKYDAARKSIVDHNPHRELIVAEGSGHMVTVERPDIVLAAVVAAVKQDRLMRHYDARCFRQP